MIKPVVKSSEALEREYSFGTDDVHSSEIIKQFRLYNLKRAERFSNLNQKPVSVSFRTADHRLNVLKVIVWAVDDDWVTLEGNLRVPIRAIIGVDF
ncbi:hypothetical protein SAMN05421823_11021 [Catalinimonas alkaloidigena]|uniref:Uncharacterized protein n=1 Tax=Catalinimonas alkaloidigena TaxID=1075417 RepID=A0A1G9Q2V5_9BACT|nr:hypothetical protein SAMN05421823_11021 [Catalinimonas alkaloidigena]